MVDIELYSNMPVCFWLKKENEKKTKTGSRVTKKVFLCLCFKCKNKKGDNRIEGEIIGLTNKPKHQNKDRILNLSNRLSKNLQKSRVENDKVWKTLGYYFFPQYVYDFSSFEEEHEYLNNWINERYEWLKDAIEEL